MNIRLAMTFVALFLMMSVVWAADNKTTDEENQILSLVLKRSFTDGGYMVVHPETTLSHFWGSDDPKEIARSKRNIVVGLQTNDIIAAKLVDRLFERNQKPVRLTLKSSPKDGYVIDFDGKYANYFGKNGGGWEKWHKENPQAHGMTRVSLPAYDQKSGLVLVYSGTQSDWLAGFGSVVLYKYDKGALKEIKTVPLWVS